MKCHQNKGFSLAEIMIAVAVLMAITVAGFSFYNNSIPKAQTSEAWRVGKLIADDVVYYFETHNGLPASNGNLAGNYINASSNLYVSQAQWILESGGLSGYIEVTMGANSFEALQGKIIRIYLEETANHSFVHYASCATNIQIGSNNGSLIPANDYSPLLPECMVDLF